MDGLLFYPDTCLKVKESVTFVSVYVLVPVFFLTVCKCVCVCVCVHISVCV